MEIIDTAEAYNDAIKVIKSGVDFDLDDGSVTLENGWRARVEAVTHTRNKQLFLYISNDRFGFIEARMSVNQWKILEAEYSSIYVNSHKAYNCTYEKVKELLSFILLKCTPKNFSDYPKIVQDEWIRLGFSFGHDLFDLMKKTVDESEWVDWAPFWRNEYYRLARILESEGRKVPPLGGTSQGTKGKPKG
jgi:hypothetical protein